MMDSLFSLTPFASEIFPSTQISQASLTNSSSTSDSTPASSTHRPRSRILETIQERPWSHIFRTPVPPITDNLSTQGTQSTSSMDSRMEQTVDSAAFAVCQSRVLRSTEDLGNLVQKLSGTITRDKENFEMLLKNVKTALDGVHKESQTRGKKEWTSGRQYLNELT